MSKIAIFSFKKTLYSCVKGKVIFIMGTNSLDNLAANGIIDFDADAYVKGTPPRYSGNPRGYVGPIEDMPLMASPSYGVYPGAHLSGHPQHDAFVNHEEKHSNPGWKRALMTILVAGLAVVGGIKYKGKLVKLKDNVINFFKAKPAAPSVPFKQKVSNFFYDAKDKIVTFFKGPAKPAPAAVTTPPVVTPPVVTSPVATAAAGTTTAGTSATTTATTTTTAKKGFWTNIPKWAKYSGIGLATTLGLYSVYKALSGGREESAHE